MMRWLRRSLTITLAVTPLACSLLVDTEGLDDHGVDTTPSRSEAGASSDGAANGGDGSTNGSGDSGADATSGDAGPLCADAGAFCDDFDLTLLGQNWSGNGADRGTVSLGQGLSRPNALSVSVTPGGTLSSGYLYKSFPANVHLRCDFDIRIGSQFGGDEVDIFDFVDIGTNPRIHQYYFYRWQNEWRFGEFGAMTDGSALDRSVATPTPKLDEWFHVRLEIVGTTVSMSFDGALAAALTGLATFPSTRRDLVLGVYYASENGSANMLYDNARCEIDPAN